MTNHRPDNHEEWNRKADKRFSIIVKIWFVLAVITVLAIINLLRVIY